MRKSLVIALMSIHLVGNTELGQLFKLPELVNHFFQHLQLNPQLSFFEFLSEHYAGDDGTKADDDFDKQLPCQNSHHNTIASVYSPMVKEHSTMEIPIPGGKEYNSRLVSPLTTEHVQLILQPPKQS